MLSFRRSRSTTPGVEVVLQGEVQREGWHYRNRSASWIPVILLFALLAAVFIAGAIFTLDGLNWI